jgi:CTP:molybdopterin cytidylyltransferase MocA
LPTKKNKNVIILAGGESSRLNFPKPFLPFNSVHNFLEKIIYEYVNFGCNKIIIVLNKTIFSSSNVNNIKNIFDVSLIINEHPEFGRFYSLKLGVNALIENKFCFIQNIDNPFIDSELLNLLYYSKYYGDYCVPYYNSRGGHPILINNKIIQRIKSESRIDLNIKDILKEYNRIEVQVQNEKCLANINTLDDYRFNFNYELNIGSKIE